jgi:hypothetical protein
MIPNNVSRLSLRQSEPAWPDDAAFETPHPPRKSRSNPAAICGADPDQAASSILRVWLFAISQSMSATTSFYSLSEDSMFSRLSIFHMDAFSFTPEASR